MSTNGPENPNYPSAYEQYNAQQNGQGQGAGHAYSAYPEASYPGGPGKAGKGLGIASLVLGILAFLSGWMFIGSVLGLVGLILGIVSLVQAKGGKGPKAMAITGIILSVLGILSTVAILTVLANYDIFGAVEACQQYQNNQQQMQECVYNYMEGSLNR